MTDSGAEFATCVLVDSGVSGSFIDQEFVCRNGIPTHRLAPPVLVYNIDGTLNEAGHITEVVDLILQYQQHAEHLLFAVTSLGQRNVILGYTWFNKHNPKINWETREVKLSRCPWECVECRDEVRALKPNAPAPLQRFGNLSGHKILHASFQSMLQGNPLFLPETVKEDLYDPKDSSEVEAEVEPVEGVGTERYPQWEVGNRVFVSVCHMDLVEEIHAMSTVSQRIAKGAAHHHQQEQKSLHELIPRSFWDFQDVFEKVSFDSLPKHCKWDHAIELT